MARSARALATLMRAPPLLRKSGTAARDPYSLTPIVHVELPPQVVYRDFQYTSMKRRRRVDPDGAGGRSRAAVCSRDRRSCLAPFGDVGDGLRRPSRTFQMSARSAAVSLVARGKHDTRALCCREPGGGQPNPARRARDDDDLFIDRFQDWCHGNPGPRWSMPHRIEQRTEPVSHACGQRFGRRLLNQPERTRAFK